MPGRKIAVTREPAAHVTAAVLGIAQRSQEEGNFEDSDERCGTHGGHLICGRLYPRNADGRTIAGRLMVKGRAPNGVEIVSPHRCGELGDHGSGIAFVDATVLIGIEKALCRLSGLAGV